MNQLVPNTIKRYRAKSALKRNSSYDIAMGEVADYILSPNNVENEIEAKELAQIIESFLDTLTEENRVIFMRRYWFSDTYKDISDRTGLSEKNISVRLTRIRKQMRDYLVMKEVLKPGQLFGDMQKNYTTKFGISFILKENSNRRQTLNMS